MQSFQLALSVFFERAVWLCFVKKNKIRFQRDTHTSSWVFLRTLSPYLGRSHLPPLCSSYCVFKELNPIVKEGLSIWQLYQAVIHKNSVWNNLGVGAGKYFLPCLLPVRAKRCLWLDIHSPSEQAVSSSWADEMQLQCRELFWLLWAVSGKCNEWDSCTNGSCAASFWGMLLLFTLAAKWTRTFAAWMNCEMTSSWGVENVLSSLGLPGSWEGTEEFFGAFKSETWGDEHLLPRDGGLTHQKLISVQQWQLFGLWNWTVPGLT